MTGSALPEGYVGLRGVGRAELLEHAEQAQRNFAAIQTALRTLTSRSVPSVSGAQDLRWVTGAVSAAGAVALAGTGDWTVARTPAGAATGDYTVTFTGPFVAATYVACLTVCSAIGAAYWEASTDSTMQVLARDLAGALADLPFSFHVLGPVG